MKRKIGILLVGVSLLAAFSVSARELTATEKNIIETSAKQRIKDPDSAKFVWQDYKGGTTYCAHINAKNSYGGYTGNSLLLVGVKLNDKGRIASVDTFIHEGEMKELMSPICTKAGYQP